MKNIFKIILTLLLIQCNVSMAQTYHKFTDTDSWYEKVVSFASVDYFWRYTAGDTIINSLNYKKILSLPAGVHYYIREDTISKMVYIKYDAVTAEYLLYDFSLTPGSSYSLFGFNNCLLDSIGTVVTSAGSRNIYYYTLGLGPLHPIVIEGVGAIEDPFLFTSYGGDPVYKLVCAYIDNVNCYEWAVEPCPVNPFVGISDFESSISDLKIFPNPLTDQSKLTFNNTYNEKFIFTLFDITGRVTESVSTTNNEITLTKDNKPSGIYLFNLVNDKTGEMLSGKIVVE